jgi:hypothetical protein
MTVLASLVVVLVSSYLVCAVIAMLVGGWISHAVMIDAPVRAVWDYGSDSRRAREWSVYFSHIAPIEGDRLPPDGQIGALRICYRNPDEQGQRWSETTEDVELLAHRRIRTFDLVGFPGACFSRRTEYEVHQHYHAVDDVTSQLAFSTRLQRQPGRRSWVLFPVLKVFYLVLGRGAGRQTFVWNLDNIKAAVEAHHHGRPYVRPHAYQPLLPWEAHPVRWWLAYTLGRPRRVAVV